jgi:hypothetical protein
MKKSITRIIVIGILLLVGYSAFATTTINFVNPIAENSFQDLLTEILLRIRMIIVIVSMVFILIGAILYMTSAGNDRRMQTAKGAIFASLIGLAIGIAAPSFLREIYEILQPVGGTPGLVSSAPTLATIAMRTLNFLLGIVGTIAIIMMVVGGIMYLTSAGDEDRMKTGKKIFIYSILGITIALASLVIVRQIGNLLT